jgi:hypothetical protein
MPSNTIDGPTQSHRFASPPPHVAGHAVHAAMAGFALAGTALGVRGYPSAATISALGLVCHAHKAAVRALCPAGHAERLGGRSNSLARRPLFLVGRAKQLASHAKPAASGTLDAAAAT